jgi:hypothetical protein
MEITFPSHIIFTCGQIHSQINGFFMHLSPSKIYNAVTVRIFNCLNIFPQDCWLWSPLIEWNTLFCTINTIFPTIKLYRTLIQTEIYTQNCFKYIHLSSTPLCQQSLWKWLLLLASVCERSNNTQGNQQMCGSLEVNIIYSYVLCILSQNNVGYMTGVHCLQAHGRHKDSSSSNYHPSLTICDITTIRSIPAQHHIISPLQQQVRAQLGLKCWAVQINVRQYTECLCNAVGSCRKGGLLGFCTATLLLGQAVKCSVVRRWL